MIRALKLSVIPSFVCLTFFSLFSFAGSTGDKKESESTAEYEQPTAIAIHLKLLNEEIDINEFRSVDKEIKFLLARWNLKGASVAVAKNGKMVYTKGYGYADQKRYVRTQPDHLFRIASVSKLITAAAIFKLVEDERLRLDDQVFGPKGLLNDSLYTAQISDQRILTITVENLLKHAAGWSRKKWGDPAFFPVDYFNRFYTDSLDLRKKVIAYTLRRQLDFNPGAASEYSNIGYIILGEVIERAAGMPYYDYVREKIFDPLHVTGIMPGANFHKDKYEDEVCYYDAPGRKLRRSIFSEDKLVPGPYGGTNVELLEASGGWVASAGELLRFVLAVDGYDDFPDILSDESVEKMTLRDDKLLPVGWIGVSDYSWWRTGTLAGASSLVIRRSDSVSYVVVTNTSCRLGNNFPAELYRAMESGLRDVQKWPETDLFRRKHFIAKKRSLPASEPRIDSKLFEMFQRPDAEATAMAPPKTKM